MRSIEINHSIVLSITIVENKAIENPQDHNMDVWAELKDGRRFSFTVFTLRNLERHLGGRHSFVTPGLLVVKELSDEAIIDAITSAAELGIEHFGILQRPELS